MHGSLIVGIEHRLNQIEDKLYDVDARASEEADCNSNDRDLDRFIFSGKYIFNEANLSIFVVSMNACVMGLEVLISNYKDNQALMQLQ